MTKFVHMFVVLAICKEEPVSLIILEKNRMQSIEDKKKISRRLKSNISSASVDGGSVAAVGEHVCALAVLRGIEACSRLVFQTNCKETPSHNSPIPSPLVITPISNSDQSCSSQKVA